MKRDIRGASATLLATLIAGLLAAPSHAQNLTFTPVDIHLEKVNSNLPTLPQIDEITLRGVEYRNTADSDGNGTPSLGELSVVDGVFTVTGFVSAGRLVTPANLNFDFEVTGTYRSLSDQVTGIDGTTGTIAYATKAETGVLTLYVSTDMTKKHNFKTGLGFDDGTVVAQFAVSPEDPIKRGGIYRIVSPFDGSRDLNMILQSSLNGFFSPVINAANLDANQDADPDNDGVGGNVPIPTNWAYPTSGVNYPLAFFANVDGSQNQGNLALEGECRMTGGSVDVNGNILLGTEVSGTDDRFQTGGQIGAPTASLPQPAGEWTHHQQTGTDGKFTFHSGTASAPEGTRIISVTCSEPGYCQPARPAPFKRIAWDGIGSFKNIDSATLLAACPTLDTREPSLHYYRALVEDIGEPGAGGVQLKKKTCNHVIGTPISATDCKSCPDAYQIEVHCTTDPDSAVIYSIGGFIDGGNFQIHPIVGESLPASTTKGGKGH